MFMMLFERFMNMTRNKRTTAKRKRRPFIKPKVVIFGEGETEKE